MPTITYVYTNDGHNLMRDGTKGAANPKISYVALGTGTNPATTGDHTLQTEVFRKRVSSYTNGTNPGEVHIDLYLGPGDVVSGAIAEVAFFGGNATSTANSGTMLCRGLYSPPHTHTAAESIQFDLDFQA